MEHDITYDNRIADWLKEKRLTIIVGHFGTGKTEVALNMALDLGRSGIPFTLADLDVVDPYFRSRERREMIESSGGRLITSSQACMDADVPSMPADVAAVFDDTECFALMDIGGDASGARVLAQYRGRIDPVNTRMICIVNANRPFTSTSQAMADYAKSIEDSCGIKVNGLINNTHLCSETAFSDIARGADIAREAAQVLNVPLMCHTADARLIGNLMREYPDDIRSILHLNDNELLYPIYIYMKKPWED